MSDSYKNWFLTLAAKRAKKRRESNSERKSASAVSALDYLTAQSSTNKKKNELSKEKKCNFVIEEGEV